MDKVQIISKTQSLCPVCLKKIDAAIVSKGKCSYLRKTCPAHGTFQTVLWRGSSPIQRWMLRKERAYLKHTAANIEKGCPYDCGLCEAHRQHTCTALIEVTQRCNLHCRFCFADADSGKEKDPSAEQIRGMYQAVEQTSGVCNIQLSGGEPTVRDDLPQLVKIGKEVGFRFIQVNTNGIRFAQDEEFVKALKDAGLDSIFLQFDGTQDSIYRTLRGKALFAVKEKAIENCEEYGIGVILVPTLVPGVNVDNIGEIIQFALKHIHAVRGVHFQPVSYFGRVPYAPNDSSRITLPEVMDELEKQTGGKIRAQNLQPAKCENSLCSFHGNFIYRENGDLTQIAAKLNCRCISKAEEGAAQAKEFVSNHWSSRKSAERKENSLSSPLSGWDGILDRIYNYSFSISGMAFQDVWNVDLERIRDCCIHVVRPDGRLIPFCIYNITDSNGKSLYRNR